MKHDKDVIDEYIFIGLIPVVIIMIFSLTIALVESFFLGICLFGIGEIFICGIIFLIFYIREIWSQAG